MKAITINKFVAICNNYLSNGEDISFTDFCKQKNYLIITESGSYEFNAEEVNKLDNSKESIIMPTTTSSLTTDKISKMYASIVEFMVDNKGRIISNSKLSSDQLLANITKEFASKQLTIPVSEETKENLLAKFDFVGEDMKMPKSHPKGSWFRKKIGYPALLTSLLIGLGAGILGSTPIAGNTIFNTGNAWLNFSSWASIGFWSAIPLTIATYAILDKATINHYAKKYCAKSNNLELLRNLENSLGHELTLEDIESASVNLPIKDLVKEIEKSRAKVIEYNKGNWFKRNIMGLKARKQHRNQLHAMFTYAKILRTQYEKAKTPEEAERINLLLNYMDKHLSDDARTNFAETATKVFENGDIYAKSIEGKRNQKVATTKLQFSKLIQRISAERYEQKEQGMLFNLAMRKGAENTADDLDVDLDGTDREIDSVLLEIRAEDEETPFVEKFTEDEIEDVEENVEEPVEAETIIDEETSSDIENDDDLNKEIAEIFNSILESEDNFDTAETETTLDAENVEAESATTESETIESEVAESETTEFDEMIENEDNTLEDEFYYFEDESNLTNAEDILETASSTSEIRMDETDSPFMKLLWSYTHDYNNMPKQLEKLDVEQKALSSEGEQISLFDEMGANDETITAPATDKTKKKPQRSTLVIDRSLKKHYKLIFTDADGNKTSTKIKKTSNETEDITNIGNVTLEKISETIIK